MKLCSVKKKRRSDFRVFDSVRKLLVRSPRPRFITLSRPYPRPVFSRALEHRVLSASSVVYTYIRVPRRRAKSHGRWIRYTVCSRSASARQTSSAFFARESSVYTVRDTNSSSISIEVHDIAILRG